MGRVDVMESRNLVDCYFSPFLHRRMGREMVISINNLCVVMRDSPFLVTRVQYVGWLRKINGQKEGSRPRTPTAQTPFLTTFLYRPSKFNIGPISTSEISFDIYKLRAFR
jgi:hypothetical protein